jgi:hypothetical protein
MRNGDVSIVNGLADSDRPRAANDKPNRAMSLRNLGSFSRFFLQKKQTKGDRVSEIYRDFVKPRDARCSTLGG